MSEHIIASASAGVGTITINRPARFNSLDVRTAQDLRRAALALARDAAVRVVVLRGTNGLFCSGADLKYIRGGGADADLGYLQPDTRPRAGGYGEVFKQILEYLHSTISEIRRAAKPFIAAVDGIAAAGGLGLAMSCDLVVASERSTFEWAYSRTGLTGAESSTFMLPRLIGLRRALDLVLLNPRLTAVRARDLGLVSEVYADDAFESSVGTLALRLAAGPTRAFGVTKGLLNMAAGIDRLDYHLDQELDNLSRSADTEEFKEGLDAFFAKREARFSAL